MKTYTINGTMTWEGVFTVHAKTTREAKEKVREANWSDWTPLSLTDWTVGTVEDIDDGEDY